MRPCLKDIVITTMRNHPRDCIFAPGAIERIVAGAPSQDYYDFGVVDYLEKAFKAEEIYCPHEGIDRREEFGLTQDILSAWSSWARHAHEVV